MAQGKTSLLQAEYAAPSSKHRIEQDIEHPESASETDAKVAYLSSLRASVVQLQGQVNNFLTQKMEEDKALANADGKAIDDKKEEENYGEEVVDEDG